MNLPHMLTTARVIPVITVNDVEETVALGRALSAGGMDTLEITLRTPLALEAVAALQEALPHATVGVGTVLTPAQLDASADQAAAFAVSPGLTQPLIDASRRCDVPLLPGAQTISEVMRAREAGFHALKFFPAEQTGGTATLKAMYPLFPDTIFCPTGGLNMDNYRNYLAQPNVACVGGTWMMPANLIAAADWSAITALATEIMAGAPK